MIRNAKRTERRWQRQIRLVAVALAVALPAIEVAPSRAATPWEQLYSSAQKSMAEGSTSKAEVAYRKALKAASTPREQSETAVALADLLVENAASPTANKAELNAAADLYRTAIEQATGQTRLIAYNNYAALLLQLDRAADAVVVLAGIEKDMRAQPNSIDVARYLYNFGRAQEMAGQPQRALALYSDALDRDHEIDGAAAASRRAAFAVGELPAAVDGLAKVIDQEIANRNLSEAEGLLRSSLTRTQWIASQAIGRMMIPLIRYFSAASIGPPEYRERWRPALLPAANVLGGRVEQLDQLYFGPLPPLVINAEGFYDLRSGLKHSYSDWREPDNKKGDFVTFAAFVQGIGDAYARADDPQGALERYRLAWIIEPRGDAILSFANVLLTSWEKVDPNGATLNSLVDVLFNEKADAYDRNDLKTLVRLHTVLGQIFERQGKFKPADDPRTATFQWQRAVDEQRRLTGDEKVSTEVPGLLAHLAAAYAASGDAPRAWNNYALASEGFIAIGRVSSAKSLWQKTKTLQLPRPAEMDNRSHALDVQLQ